MRPDLFQDVEPVLLAESRRSSRIGLGYVFWGWLFMSCRVTAITIQMCNEFDLRRARQVEVQNQALGLARFAAAEQHQIVHGIRQVLVARSELPSIKTKASQACNPRSSHKATGSKLRSLEIQCRLADRIIDRMHGGLQLSPFLTKGR